MTGTMNATRTVAGQAAGTAAVKTSNLWKTFGALAALRGVSIRVAPGERLAILGPNGSGKSTLLRVLATLISPSVGRASICGYDVQSQSEDVRRLIGVVCHQTFLYSELTALENVQFYARLYGVSDPDGRSQEVLRLVGMEKSARTPARALSRGMQQRLALGRAIVHDPEVLLLDEPDTGLDQRWSGFLADLLADAAHKGRSVVLTTHNLERSLDVSDRVMVLNAGKVAFVATRGELDVGSLREYYFQHTGGTH